MRLRLIAVALFCALLTPLAGRADVINYTFNSTVRADGLAYGFSFDEPTILTDPTNVPDLLSWYTTNGSVITSAFINPTNMGNSACLGNGFSCLVAYIQGAVVRPDGGGAGFIPLFDETLESLGTYTSPDGVLTITDLSTTPTVPEPSDFILLGTGLLALIPTVRSRFASHRPK